MSRPIERGCWVLTSTFGEGVVTAVEKNWVTLRYKAMHMAQKKEMWVITSVPNADVEYLKPVDAVSLEVLEMRGPYGMDKGPR